MPDAGLPDDRLSCWIDGERAVAVAPRHSGGDTDRAAHWIPVCEEHAERWHDETANDEQLPLFALPGASKRLRIRCLRLSAAQELQENDWLGPAEDIRDGIHTQTVIRRVSEMAGDADELDRALPILAALEAAIESVEHRGDD